jgi:ubiquinone biosynthesis O-methyltransferase
MDRKEVAKFEALAQEWWNPKGPFAPLHALNRARVAFLRQVLTGHFGRTDVGYQPLTGLSVLDVGCGGGLLTESLARLGASVTGIDLTEANVAAAKQHAALDKDLASALRCAARRGTGQRPEAGWALAGSRHSQDLKAQPLTGTASGAQCIFGACTR